MNSGEQNGRPTRKCEPVAAASSSAALPRGYLDVSPADGRLRITSLGADAASFFISNHNKFPVVFKLKSTNPEAIRVYPFRGLIYPSEMLSVDIEVLDAEFSPHEKLLLLTLPDGETAEKIDIGQFKIQLDLSDVNRHRRSSDRPAADARLSEAISTRAVLPRTDLEVKSEPPTYRGDTRAKPSHTSPRAPLEQPFSSQRQAGLPSSALLPRSSKGTREDDSKSSEEVWNRSLRERQRLDSIDERLRTLESQRRLNYCLYWVLSIVLFFSLLIILYLVKILTRKRRSEGIFLYFPFY